MSTLYEISRIGSNRVDREAGIIRGVKILGSESKNGRTYTAKAMEQAARHYQGREVNINHPDRKSASAERRIEDGFGWLESIEIKPDGVYGDLHYLKEHPVASLVAEAAERNPNRFGLSHNAEGTVSRDGDRNVVESIESVRSVDLVQSPATNRGLFESSLWEEMNVPAAIDQLRKAIRLHERHMDGSEPTTGDEGEKSQRKLMNQMQAALAALMNRDESMGEMAESHTIRETLEQHAPRLLSALMEDGALLPPEMMDEPMAMSGAEQDATATVKAAMAQIITAMLDLPGDLRAMCTQLVPVFQKIISGQPEQADPENPAEESDPTEEPDPTAAAPGDKTNPDTAADPTAAQDPSAEPDPANPFAKRKKPMAESTTPTVALSPDQRAAILQENKELKERLSLLEAKVEMTELREHCTKMLEENRREVTGPRLTALARMDDDASRVLLIEEWPVIQEPDPAPPRRPKPSFSLPLRESAPDNVKYPSDLNSFVAACR